MLLPTQYTQGFDKATAKKHLLIFALAAPVAAFFSYFGLTRVSWGLVKIVVCMLVYMYIHVHVYTWSRDTA